MQYKATLRYLHMTPRKVRRAAELVRGKTVSQAETLLGALPLRAARPLKKLIAAAAASSKDRGGAGAAGLIVKRLQVNEGPRLKRSMPRAFGRTSPLTKRLSHVTLVVEETVEPPVRKSAVAPLIEAPGAPQAPLSQKAIQRPAFRPSRSESTKVLKKRSRIRDLGRRFFQRKAI